jgi:hypothetical protein
VRRKNHGYQVKKKERRKFLQGKKETNTKDNKPGFSRNYLFFHSKLAFTWLYSSLPRKESRKALTTLHETFTLVRKKAFSV